MKRKISQCITKIVPSALGWLSVAVAILIDGSFVQEFTLATVARVLP